MEFKLEDTIETLKEQYGERVLGQKHGTEVVCIPKKGRKDILRHLVNTAKEFKQEKDYFKKGTVQYVIFKACFPDAMTKHWSKDSLRGAHSVVVRELNEVLAEIFPEVTYPADPSEPTGPVSTGPASIKEWNPSKQGRIAPEVDRSITKDVIKPSGAEDAEAAALLGGDDE